MTAASIMMVDTQCVDTRHVARAGNRPSHLPRQDLRSLRRRLSSRFAKEFDKLGLV